MYPENYRYTREHEWIEADSKGSARVGITHHAQSELGDVVFVQLPDVGKSVEAARSFGVVESVKAVSDLYMPVPAKVVEVNSRLGEKPELVNQDPHGEGWIVKVQISDQAALAKLMTAAEYQAFLKG